jgi:hypothetical protein
VTPTSPFGGGGRIHYQLSPDPTGRAFVSGTQNTITLMGQPGTPVSVSVYLPGDNSCLSMNVQLDDTGQGSVMCNIPAQLQGSQVVMAFITPGGQQQYNVQVR